MDYTPVLYVDRLALVQTNDSDSKCIDIVTIDDVATEGIEGFSLSLIIDSVPYAVEVTTAVAQIGIIDNESKFRFVNSISFNSTLLSGH